MTFENRSAVTDSSGCHRQSSTAMVSSRCLPREYTDSGRPGYSSSTGTYGGGVSNGSPSTVSLDAMTTFEMPSRVAACSTLNVVSMLLRNVATSLCRPGAGIAARCTTASAAGCSPRTPPSASTTCP